MSTTQLQRKDGFSSNIILRMKRNGYISLDTVESICRALSCGVDDILEFVLDAGDEKNTRELVISVEKAVSKEIQIRDKTSQGGLRDVPGGKSTPNY